MKAQKPLHDVEELSELSPYKSALARLSRWSLVKSNSGYFGLPTLLVSWYLVRNTCLTEHASETGESSLHTLLKSIGPHVRVLTLRWQVFRVVFGVTGSVSGYTACAAPCRREFGSNPWLFKPLKSISTSPCHFQRIPGQCGAIRAQCS